LEALKDTNKSFQTGMPFPRTPTSQKPQKGHTSGGGGKKGKKKSEGVTTSDQGTTQLEEEQEQQQPLSATFSDKARFEDLAASMENPETGKEVLQPRTESLVIAPQQAEDGENSRPSVTGAEDRKTTRQNVEPGPTGPPGPSGQTRSRLGATAPVGERAGAEKGGNSSGQVPGEGDSPPGRRFRPDLDESNSDLDISVPMYAINDPEFCTELMVRTVSLLSPNAIQQVSQTLAQTASTVQHPFPVLTRYFVAKERYFRAICADFLRLRELLRQGELPIFLHDDHPKLLDIVAMKFRAVKATYQSYHASDMPNDSINIQLIKQHMTECMRVYYSVLPQLDILAAYHSIPLSDSVSNHGGDLDSLRSEGAQQRRSAVVDQDLREQLSDTRHYVNTQAAEQSQGLQRRYDFQERTLTSREEELRRNSKAMRRETERRRGVEEELSRVREELRESNVEVRQGRIRRPYDRPGEEEANRSENARRLRDGNIHSADYSRREINHSDN
jgi:hypothetical protein